MKIQCNLFLAFAEIVPIILDDEVDKIRYCCKSEATRYFRDLKPVPSCHISSGTDEYFTSCDECYVYFKYIIFDRFRTIIELTKTQYIAIELLK